MKNSGSDVFLIFKKKKNCTFLNFGATIELKSNSRSQNIFPSLTIWMEDVPPDISSVVQADFSRIFY